MKTWDDWSDEDINRAMTCIVYNCHGCELTKNGNAYYHCGVDGSGYYVQYIIDFCNSPEEMWPIIVNNGIGLIKLKSGYQAVHSNWGFIDISSTYDDINDCCIGYDDAIDYGDTNPLRAAAIVFLMMNGVNP